MVNKIRYIDGQLHTTEEIKRLLNELVVPTVFTNQISDWEASKWSLKEFTRLFGDIVTTFKLYEKNNCESRKRKLNEEKISLSSPVVMETDCYYVTATFKEFQSWLDVTTKDDCGELGNYSCDLYWCYADYNYMAELFQNKDEKVLAAVDWCKFGYPNRNGSDSTIWIGSEGSFTPCHQDTYGSNLVAQIDGVKRWYLFPPSDAEMLRPTRIPYEESSVFCTTNPTSSQFQKNCYKVDLQPGDVLFVPKHWWHYVESIHTSISINTWLEQIDDDVDRIRESLVHLLVHSLKLGDGTPTNKWLNPKQELSSPHASLQLVRAAFLESCNETHDNKSFEELFRNNDFIINCISEPEVLDVVIKVMKRKIERCHEGPG